MWWASFFLIFMCTQEDLCVFIFFLLFFSGHIGRKKNLTCFHFKPKSVVTIDQLFFSVVPSFSCRFDKIFSTFLFFWSCFHRCNRNTDRKSQRLKCRSSYHRSSSVFFLSCELCEMIVVMNPKKSKTRISVD